MVLQAAFELATLDCSLSLFSRFQPPFTRVLLALPIMPPDLPADVGRHHKPVIVAGKHLGRHRLSAMLDMTDVSIHYPLNEVVLIDVILVWVLPAFVLVMVSEVLVVQGRQSRFILGL